MYKTAKLLIKKRIKDNKKERNVRYKWKPCNRNRRLEKDMETVCSKLIYTKMLVGWEGKNQRVKMNVMTVEDLV